MRYSSVDGVVRSIRVHMNQETRRPYKLYSVQDLLELKDNPNRWIVDQMVPWPGRTLVHGKGGDYKSTVFFDLAVSVASGGELLQEFPVRKHGPVILISTEGNIYANKDRLFGHMRPRNLEPSTVQLFYGQESLFVDEPNEFQVLVNMIDHVKPVMIVLDPFVSFFAGDENSVTDVKKFLRRVDPLINDYELSVVVIHHSRKDGEIRGSTALQGWTDSALKFEVAREVTLPSVPEPVSILTVECEKQRNGQTGKLFTAVPFVNDALGQVTFGIYKEVQAKDVGAVYLKQAMYALLRNTEEPLTKGQLQTHFNIGPKRIKTSLDALIALDLVELTDARRSTGGARTRSVDAYGARAKNSRVDSVREIIAHAAAKRPVGSIAYAVDDRDPGGVCLAGISKGPRV